MSQSTPTPASRFAANRPPRIFIRNPHNNNGSAMGSIPPTAGPYTAQTNNTMGAASSAAVGQPYWPQYSNPFAAGNFMAKGFEGFVDFTKSGMSSGEKFTYSMYEKFSKWSKKWFTHIFLFLVVFLYTVGGALLFKAVEGRNYEQQLIEIHTAQKELFRAIQRLAEDLELRKYSTSEFDGKLVFTMREHQPAVESLLTNYNTLEELEKGKEPWSFWNAMFYCGTIYTTIGKCHRFENKRQRHRGKLNKFCEEIFDKSN